MQMNSANQSPLKKAWDIFKRGDTCELGKRIQSDDKTSDFLLRSEYP